MAVKNTGGAVSRLDDGIFLLPGRSGGGCNVFLLKGSRKNILIDVGLESDRDHLEFGLSKIGLAISDIQMVLLTHEHMDHVGGIPDLPGNIVVAAHGRAADKVRLNDQFSIMSGAFGGGMRQFHIDFHLEDGMVIDIGDIRLKVIYTPGHSSGSVCFFEPNRGILFSGDTIFAGGILGGIFSSGNLSDYISSLERLREFRIHRMYPSHGRMSTNPIADVERAIAGSVALMSDTNHLFDSISVDKSFKSIMSATAGYSKRAAERRRDARFIIEADILLNLPDGDHAVGLVDISTQGAKLDRVVGLDIGKNISITLSEVWRIDCRVVSHDYGHTRLEFLPFVDGRDDILEWLEVKRQAGPIM